MTPVLPHQSNSADVVIPREVADQIDRALTRAVTVSITLGPSLSRPYSEHEQAKEEKWPLVHANATMDSVLGILACFGIAAVTGAAVARWWIVLVPFALAAIWLTWLAIAAMDRGSGLGRIEVWTWPVLFYGLLAVVAAAGLAIGVALRRWARDWPRDAASPTTLL